jgi:outer membrane receptor protein involved in Fe transport
VPVFFFPEPPAPLIPEERPIDWKEKFARAYLYWTPHEWLALRAEYQYEKFDREEEFAEGIKEVKTHRFPLGVGFFHPCGLSANLQATYYDQVGVFDRQIAPGIFLPGDDQFWVVDAAIGYRLPKRYGFITVGAKNLFDESFSYADTDPVNPKIQPERLFFARITLSL